MRRLMLAVRLYADPVLCLRWRTCWRMAERKQ